MFEIPHFTSVTFSNYKAFKRYSVSLRDFNVMVGPNNSGKSTIIGAFRILAEGMRKASAKRPEFISFSDRDTWGYRVNLENLPVSTENIFSNYDETNPAVVEFRLSNGNKLAIIFPEQGICYLECRIDDRVIRTPSDFRREYKASVGFVPVLGPVEHNEPLYQQDTARRALQTHRASRNFRNIWHHYPEDFEEFRELIQSTWPGMDIEKPEINYDYTKPVLHMFCPEYRYPREIYWAGFGFQVWCQMLTYIVKAKKDSLLIIDEPDIYLHSDLQRQLVSLLKNIEQGVLIATHSTEIISEAEPDDLLIINKKALSAKRIKNPSQLQKVFNVLGSNLNPTLTQLAKTKRVVFVEGKDFQLLSSFARKLGKHALANRSDFAVIPVEGFNPLKVRDLSKGMEFTLDTILLKAVVFDRDYRIEEEMHKVCSQLDEFACFTHIHTRKEIENYLLVPTAIDRAISRRIKEHTSRTNVEIICDETADTILEFITNSQKSSVEGHFLDRRAKSVKATNPSLDTSTINAKLLEEFDGIWIDLTKRLDMVPGKETLSQLNTYLQNKYKITLTAKGIINAMREDEIPEEIKELICKLDDFRQQVL